MTLTAEPLTASISDIHPLPPPVHHEPLQVADGVYLIRQLQGEGGGPFAVYVNSLVITGSEPVIVDTGGVNNRARWLEDVGAIVDLKKVRWIYISHDDQDHLGNLDPVLSSCTAATLVVDWLTVERTSIEYNLPLRRMRWLNDGDHFVAGDRTLVALRPPTYDAPTTRGLFDTKSRVYWASDSFGAAVPYHVDRAADLPFEAWSAGFTLFNRTLSPWTAIVDRAKFAERISAVRTLDAKAIATCHGPVIAAWELDEAYRLMADLPGAAPMPTPGQPELEAMLAAIAHG
jgi:flavorubredoxin